MSNELKACPFCGFINQREGIAVSYSDVLPSGQSVRIICGKCGAQSPPSVISFEHACDLWDERDQRYA